ncbi:MULTISPECIES: ATP-binding cassette domain-containing protein [Oceanotoga]|jgi:NitT/TauT family transport system permease protein|uniref:NitT/TauT family transport system permease protein n=1 Tax=Oceanotoga teriensis TaxID=515440 RepID=A0AA45HHF8_9BACT|nr:MULTISPECIES: ATP-binding cassette domain-containing protein [Oceanotoga]MDN5343552.1 hypothetical protein [Oceanotoga sp.]MDO7977865.1 ATP-binding cassette domain-containing protein [Oceanotoga teriensis]PWJ86806.1 NitT/TauT family transport system permease protein [Oceanotoga teriensis]
MFLIGISLFIIIWFIISLFYSPLILPSPILTFKTLFSLFITQDFWINYFDTLLKSIIGFSLSIIIGIPIGLLAGIKNNFYKMIRPIVMILQGAPVISYIAITMLWFGIGFYTPVFVSFIIILPTLILNISEGIKSTDTKLLEMANIYKVSKSYIYKYIFLPSIIPFLISSLKIISGTLWRSIVAGEFLAGSKGIGYSLALAKSTLNTEEVFAYTIFLILNGIIFEKLILKLNFKPKISLKNNKIIKSKNINKNNELILKNVSKCFNNKYVLKNFSYDFSQNIIYCIAGESGIGKTTILKIISGLLPSSSGELISSKKRLSYIFQEDRLIPWLNVKDNIKFVSPNISDKKIKDILSSLNIYDSLEKYPEELSGGMKKRVNIARAISYNSDIILMDEPFSSLDIKNKNNIIKDFKNTIFNKNLKIILVSHEPFEIANLAQEIIVLEENFKFKKLILNKNMSVTDKTILIQNFMIGENI